MTYPTLAGKTLLACAVLFFGCLPLGWGETPPLDSDKDGLTDGEEAALGTNPRSSDTDGDGLLDGWEAHGYWRAGSFEPLPAYGADPRRKDVFVELDWMADEGGSPLPNAIIAYQAAADVTRVFNRSGKGIAIHFDLGPRIASILPASLLEPDVDFSAFANEPDEEKVLPYQDRFAARPGYGDDAGSTTLSLYDVYYGGRYFRPSRRNIFYYVILVEQSRPLESEAVEDVWRNHPYSDDFSDELARRDGLVNAGVHVGVIFRKPAADLPPEELRYQYSAALLHELGHAFGLGHGGALPGFRWDNTNWKPNYPSIMNYRFSGCAIDFLGGRPVMDFSHGLLKVSLDERALFEIVGMGKLTNEHILECAGVLPPENGAAGFPASLDWNKDNWLTLEPLRLDLNRDEKLEVLSDHDDWGKLRRDGFDGIGLNAYRGCGLSCGRGDDVKQVSCESNGDGMTDIFLARGEMVAWALSTGDDSLAIVTEPDHGAAGGTWTFDSGDSFLAGDFLGAGHDMIFTHRGREAAIFDRGDKAPRLAWYADDLIGDGAPDAGGGWKLGPADRFLAVKLSGPATTDLVVMNGRALAVLSAAPDGTGGLRTTWSSGDALFNWTRREAPSIRRGRTFQDGRESFFIVSATGLIEVTGPPSKPVRARVDTDGVIPPSEALPAGWELSSGDGAFCADVDGDGVEDLILKGSQRLGVVRWDGDGLARLEWAASGSINDSWPLSKDVKTENLWSGQFVAGDGKEIVISNGQSWVTLGWRASTSSLEILAINDSQLIADDVTWQLSRSQAVIPGRFLPGDVDTVLVQGDSSLLIARFEADGFRPVVRVDRAVGSWTLQPDDVLEPVNLDADPELELLARNGNRFGVIDLSPAPSNPFLADLDVETLAFHGVAKFRRGDTNDDGGADISDVVMLLGYLFLGVEKPRCADASDVDDSGIINVSDPIYLLSFLFNGGKKVPPPGPFTLGIDPTQDDLGCDE